MMKISFCPYDLVALATLQGKNTHNVRQGALLRVEFEDETIGYADCHPWVELGDLSLKEQLDLLKKREITPLTQRSLYFAQIDAMARSLKKSAFDFEIPPSHLLIPNLEQIDMEKIDSAIKQGFTHFKIKLGGSIPSELKQLSKLSKTFSDKEILYRFDFNQRLTPEEFESVLSAFADLKLKIDFIEDPFPFDKSMWEKFQTKYGIQLGCDYQSHRAIGFPKAADVLVIKPAVQDEAIFLASLKNHQRLVITSYLDHPIGQLSAAYVASLCSVKDPSRVATCGLLSHLAYQPNAFSEQLKTKGPDLLPPQGTGFGFDALLEKQAWQNL
jgi:o-succinylbenzoate synthase